jgi:hypothetical protein
MRWAARAAVAGNFVGCDAIVRSPLWGEPHPQLGSTAHYRFVLSPPGKGQDTHRTWEALSVGSVPIVTALSPINGVYAGLPVVQVRSWDAVTPPKLRALDAQLHSTAAAGGWDFDRVYYPFWYARVRCAAKDAVLSAAGICAAVAERLAATNSGPIILE